MTNSLSTLDADKFIIRFRKLTINTISLVVHRDGLPQDLHTAVNSNYKHTTEFSLTL